LGGLPFVGTQQRKSDDRNFSSKNLSGTFSISHTV
jgi:hypothetical protein